MVTGNPNFLKDIFVYLVETPVIFLGLIEKGGKLFSVQMSPTGGIHMCKNYVLHMFVVY